MSISSEISRLSGNVSDAFDAVDAMGGTVPSGANSDDLAAAIQSIPQSGGGGAVSDVLWVTADLNLLDFSFDNRSHTYAQILSAYQSDKIIKLKVNYGDGVEYSAETILDLQTAEYSESSVRDFVFSGLMVVNFGAGEEVYLLRVIVVPNATDTLEIRLLNSTQIV